MYAFDVERGPPVWGHDERQTMSEKMDQDDGLGAIRALIKEGESHQAWRDLCAMLEQWEDEDDLEARVLPIVDEMLTGWDDTLRSAPSYWVDPLLDGEHVPHFKIVRALDLRSKHLVLEDAELLAESPELQNIHRLNLAYNGLQDEGTRALVRSEMIANVRWMDLAGNSVGLLGLKCICDSEHMGHLEHLDMTGNWVDDDGAVMLAETDKLPSLRRLILRGNPIHPEGAEAIVASPYLHESIKDKWRDF